MRSLFITGCLVLAALVLGACGGGQQVVPPKESGGEIPALTASPAPKREPAIGRLDLQLTLDRAAYKQGEPVMMSFAVTNAGEQPLTLLFADSQRYDFTVICGLAAWCPAPIWEWSHDRLFAQAVGQETLAPGQSITYSQTWSQTDNAGQPVPSGDYQAYASFVGCLDGAARRCDALISNVVLFQVAP